MIQSYLDESGVHDGASVCVIAGYFGEKVDWGRFDSDWRIVFDEFKIPMAEFHATSWVRQRRYAPAVESLATTIGHHKIYPVSVGLVVEHFNGCSLEDRKFLTGARVTDGRLITTGAPSKPYFMPFQQCLKRVAEYTGQGDKADFYFGLGRAFADYARILLKEIREHPESPFRERLGQDSYPLAKDTPGLQAADLLAHLTYLDMQERVSKNSWDSSPSPLLRTCLVNARRGDDFFYYDDECIEGTLAKAREITGEWSASGLDRVH